MAVSADDGRQASPADPVYGVQAKATVGMLRTDCIQVAI